MGLADQSVVIFPDNPITELSNTYGFHRWRVEANETPDFPTQCHSTFAILQQFRGGDTYLWMCYTPTDITVDHLHALVGSLNQQEPGLVSYCVVTEFDDLLSRPFGGKLPANAIKLNSTPVSDTGAGCDVDGDVDRFGRIVVFIDQQWWGWYPNPNEPFF